MIENIKCPKCGHEYPWQVPREYCRFCRTELTRGTCYLCKQYNDRIRHGKCQACSNKLNVKSVQRSAARAKSEYAEWLEKIKVPKPIVPLSEDDWIRACSYFGGCALCDSDQIDARLLFVPGSRGGTYTMFNVIPACEKCATALRQAASYKGDPFSVRNIGGTYKPRLTKIRAYLQERLDEYGKTNGI